MVEFIKELLKRENIFCSSYINLRSCRIIKPYLLERAGISDGGVVIFAIPYLTSDGLDPGRNISSYAVPRDYHGYIKELSERIIPILSEKYPNNIFALFADRSPIDERDAAVKAGLGVIGLNNMLITKQYSSYVFLAEIITDAKFEKKPLHNGRCEGCGECLRACPGCISGKDYCLSELTQRKGELSQNDRNILNKHRLIWGCDTCQEVCPHTIRAITDGTIFTPIEYFQHNLVTRLDVKALEEMTDEEFAKRAYSWRSKNVIMRNIKIKEESEEQKC